MTIKTTLKLARASVEKLLAQNPDGGYKVEQNGRKVIVKYSELLEELRTLESLADNIKVVTLCKDCGNYAKGSTPNRGCCFPKSDFTSGRGVNDYCSVMCKSKG